MKTTGIKGFKNIRAERVCIHCTCISNCGSYCDLFNMPLALASWQTVCPYIEIDPCLVEEGIRNEISELLWSPGTADKLKLINNAITRCIFKKDQWDQLRQSIGDKSYNIRLSVFILSSILALHFHPNKKLRAWLLKLLQEYSASGREAGKEA